VRKNVRDFLTPRKPEPKQLVDPVGKKLFISMCQRKEKQRFSEYDHSITMSYEKKGTHRSSIPHLRKQSQQLIPPLQVLSKENVAMADFVVDMTLTKDQLRGRIMSRFTQGRQKTIVLKEPLMWPEFLKMLPMRMYELHQ